MASGLLEMIFLFRSRLLQQMRDTISNLLKIIFLFRGPDIINIYAARFFTLLCYRWSSKGIEPRKI